MKPEINPIQASGGPRALSLFRSVVFISGVAVTLAGCATIEPPRSAVERNWPPPPDPPVIRYISSFSQPKDMGTRGGLLGWFRKAFGFVVGEGAVPYMLRPYGVATDGTGRVYITDTGVQAVHIYDFRAKRYRQIFWIERGASRLMSPVGVTLDGNGMIYVSDSQHNRIFVYEPKRLRLVRIIGEPDQFQRLTGIAFDQNLNRLYAVDTAANQIWALGPDGETQAKFGRRGKADGELNFPTHITVDSEGLLYVTDSMNFRVQIFDSEGRFQGKFGQLGRNLGSFSKPKGVAVDTEGHIYVVEGIYDTVQVFNREGAILMNFGQTGEKEGDFWLPAGIAIDSENRIYVADTYNQRVQIFRFLGTPDEGPVLAPESE